MFVALVSLKVKFPSVKFQHDAGYSPVITFVVPGLTNNDLRRSVLSSVDYISLIVLVISRRSKVNEFDA